MSDYSHRSPFARVLGNPDRVNLLDVLLTKGHRAIPVEQLAEFTGATPEAVQADLEVLISANLVEELSGGYGLAETSEAELLREYHLQSHESLDDVLASTDEL